MFSYSVFYQEWQSVDEWMEIHVVKASVTPEYLSFPSLHIASMSYFIRSAEPNLCGTWCMSGPNDKDLDLVDSVSS